jgi:hypothetical protein
MALDSLGQDVEEGNATLNVLFATRRALAVA